MNVQRSGSKVVHGFTSWCLRACEAVEIAVGPVKNEIEWSKLSPQASSRYRMNFYLRLQLEMFNTHDFDLDLI